MEDHQIRELSKKTHDSILDILNDFKFIQIDYEEINSFGQPEKDQNGTPQSLSTSDQTPDAGEIQESRPRNFLKSPSVIYDKLLSDRDIGKLKDTFKVFV